MKLKNLKIFYIFIFVFSFFFIQHAFAEGTYTNIGTTYGDNAGSDAVSWSQSSPINFDSYGNEFVAVENGSGTYSIAYSNNKGATWSLISSPSDLGYRPTLVYDSIHDKIQVIINSNISASYFRYTILRDHNYGIAGVREDFSKLTLDSASVCTGNNAYVYPTLTFKNDGINGILVAMWNIDKTCSGTNIIETRASMRVLSNDSNDFVAVNWSSLNGSPTHESPSGADANVAYNTMTSSTGTHSLPHSVILKEASGNHTNDLYYFDYDNSSTNGFRRLTWNSSNNNWSGSWSTRTAFGGTIDNTKGYSLKQELITKPIYNSSDGNFYIGIARWLDNVNGDTQSLFKVDTSDNVTLVSDIYSAEGSAWFAPTLDISFNQYDNKVYIFYETSSNDPLNSGTTNTADNGKFFYRTFNGSSLGTPQPFFTTLSGYTGDIPIVYNKAINGRIPLFFRADGTEGPQTPPHHLFSGYLSTTNTSSLINSSVSPYTASNYSDFNNLCSTKSAVNTINTSNAKLSLSESFRDDFETPITPYNSLFSDLWSTGSFGAGTSTYLLNGNLEPYGTGGSYALSTYQTTYKTLEFSAKFTSNNFQHIGWVSDSNFSYYLMFSTKNGGTTGHLYARSSGDGDTDLGTGYLDSYHTYKIDWNNTNTNFYIDGVNVSTHGTISNPLSPMISTNDLSSTPTIMIDWIHVLNYPTLNGTYTSCAIDTGINNAQWGTGTFNTTTPTGTNITVQTQTSVDNSTWSTASSLTSGSQIQSSSGRYIKYIINFTSNNSTQTPLFNSISLNYTSPVIPTTTPVPTTSIVATTTVSTTSTTAPITTIINQITLIPDNSTVVLLYNGAQNVTTDKPFIKGHDSRIFKIIVQSTPQTYLVTPDSNGVWSQQINTSLSNGVHTVTAYDSSGNVLGVTTFTVNAPQLANTGTYIISSLVIGIVLIIAIILVNKRKKIEDKFANIKIQYFKRY